MKSFISITVLFIICNLTINVNAQSLKSFKDNKGKYGYKDEKGNVIINPKYEDASGFYEGLASVELKGKYGFIDESGNVIIPFVYNYATVFSEGLAPVLLKGKYGYINKTGIVVIPFKFENAKIFREGLAYVKLNGRHGFIDKDGDEIIPIKYEDAGLFHEGLVSVKLNGKYGFINMTGEEVIPFKFDNGSSFINGEASVTLDGKKLTIDKNGNEINKNSDKPKNTIAAKEERNPYSVMLTTKVGLTWQFPDEGFKIDSSDVEKSYHYITPLKDAEIYVKVADMNKLNREIRDGALYPLASERIKDLKADAYSVNGIEVKDYLKSFKSENLILGYLATHTDGNILFFYTHKSNFIISIHILNYNSKFPTTKKDFDAFLNSIHF